MKTSKGLPMGVALAVLSVGSVLLVALGLFPMALKLMERLAEENAQKRVELAAWGEQARLDERLAELERDAHLLAERPTLNQLIAEGNWAGLATYLDHYQVTSGFDACAIATGDHGHILAPQASAERFDAAIEQADGASGYIVVEGRLAALAFAAPKDHPQQRLAVVMSLAATAPAQTRSDVALRLVAGSTRPQDEDHAFSYRLKLGQGSGWIEASLSRSAVEGSLEPLHRTLLWITFTACLLVAGLGLAVGRWLVRPLHRLRKAAMRIGEGDLHATVGPVPGLETGALASTMEEMRLQLLDLTQVLRQREDEAKAILSGIVEGVFSVDENRRINYLNQQAAAMLGMSESEAMGRFCGDVLRPQELGGRPCEDQCPIVHARSRGRSRAVEQLQLAGGLRTVVITSAPGHGTTQVQVMRDETEIETARRARDAILAHVSHEFKTPLSAQLASIELLRDGLGTMSLVDSRAMVAAMERSVLRLMQLIDNLLESVRIETGAVRTRSVAVELDAVLEEAVAMTLPLFEQRNQRLELPASGLPEVWGDPQQLTQVLVNLLANAQKFSPDGALIRVLGTEAADEVTLFVEDQGPGIQAALSDSIFDRFQRLSPQTKGMGMGLWIVRAIVERHGGSVRVQSSSLGGACFALTLPLEKRVI